MTLDYGTLLLLAVPGLFLLALSIAKPETGLAVMVFVVYTNLSDVLISEFGFPSVTQPLVALAVVSVVARLLLFQEKIRGWTQPFVLLSIYTILGYISIYYAADVKVATEALTYYSKNAIIGLLVVFVIQKPSSLRWAMWALIFAGILMGTISLFQVLTGTFSNNYWGFGDTIHLDDGYRIAGSIGDPNYYAQIMVALLPIILGRFLYHKSFILRSLAGWSLFVCVLTALYTYSRGGFLALAVVGFLFFIRQPARPWTAAIVITAVVLIVFQFLPSQYTSRISSLFEFAPGNERTSAKTDASLEARSASNLVALKMFLDNPIFGVGVGNFNVRYDYYARQYGLGHETTGAHNLYLEVASERGLLGFFSFFAIIYSTFMVLQRTKLKAEKENLDELVGMCDSLTLSLAGYLVASIFLHGAYVRYLWLLLGIAWGTPQSIPLSQSARLMGE